MKDYKTWDGYVKPGRIFGNLYFVGTKPASTHIIDTGDGLIMIDPGYGDKLDLVLENMREIGLNPYDIKYILLSHGHYDHTDATKELVEMTGAKTFIGKEDLPLLTGEIYHYKIIRFTPDVLLEDGDVVELGNTKVLCLSTPGHTDGTMSFFFDVTDGNHTYKAGMFGGAGHNTLTKRFLTEHNFSFESRDKYFASLDRLENITVEIFIGNHVGNNDTVGRLARLQAGEDNPFIDGDLFKAFIVRMREKLKKMIQDEDEFYSNAVSEIEKNKIIVIVRGVARDKLLPLVQAMYDGGIRLVECTYDASGEITDEEIAGNIEMLAKEFEGKMYIGAGTVLTENQVELTKKAGGRFIISPDVNEAVIKMSNALGLVSIPGAITPTEASSAHRAGADFIKLFPIDLYGPKYIKTIKAPLSHVRVLAVNGITADNMKAYLEAGACGVGIGSGIVNKTLIEKGDFAGITTLAKSYTSQL